MKTDHDLLLLKIWVIFAVIVSAIGVYINNFIVVAYIPIGIILLSSSVYVFSPGEKRKRRQ